MTSSQIGGAIPFPMPPSATGVGKSDKQIARNTAAKLTTAIKATKDPALKAEFAKSLAQLHSYLSQDTKSAKQGSVKAKTPKVNPPKKKA